MSKKSSTKTHLEIWDAEGHRFTSDNSVIVCKYRCFRILLPSTPEERLYSRTPNTSNGQVILHGDIIDVYFNRREIAVITRNSINTYDQ